MPVLNDWGPVPLPALALTRRIALVAYRHIPALPKTAEKTPEVLEVAGAVGSDLPRTTGLREGQLYHTSQGPDGYRQMSSAPTLDAR
jgi:hypothetical protein